MYVTADAGDGRLALVEGPLSTPRLKAYFEALGIALEPGWRAEVNLRAIAWIGDAARRLERGFIIVIDYGHQARELYSLAHAGGTLTTFRRHTAAGADGRPGAPPWLTDPGNADITSHVDFTSVCAAAEAEGLKTIAVLDQTYFLLGIVEQWERSQGRMASNGAVERPAMNLGQLKTLIMPGGIGSTHKVLIFGKDVGEPHLMGCSYRVRLT